VIMSDSNSAIDIMNNAKINDWSKHIDISYHFTREQVEAGNVTVLYVPSAENLADICTKGLSREILEHLCKKSFCTKWEGVLEILGSWLGLVKFAFLSHVFGC
jgi:hypothetical protein